MPAKSAGAEAVFDAAIVGAGVAGLQCARRLHDAGWRVAVLDKARGVGGRVATRRVNGQPVDHGAPFLHGSDPRFLAALAAVPGPRIDGWPARVVGQGAPCQPDAFRPTERRLAFAEGLTAFPKHLARGLDVRLGTRVTRVVPTAGQVVVEVEAGDPVVARAAVLALPVEQLRALLPAGEPGLRASAQLLGWFASIPALALLAGYPPDGPDPGFDLMLPDDPREVSLISHDSAKRRDPACRALVIQASRRWSAARLEAPAEVWGPELLAAAAGLVGPWVEAPLWTSTHRWRYARVDSGLGLGGPILHALAGGARLGLTGEIFHPRGGVQGAFLAGDTLADRLLDAKTIH